MKLSVVHDARGAIVAITASPDGAPLAHVELKAGESLAFVDDPELQASLGDAGIRQRLRSIAGSKRMDIAAGTLVPSVEKRSRRTSQTDLLEPEIDQFIEFIKYAADNNLWEEAKQKLASEGITTIVMGRRPIEVFRQFLIDKILEEGAGSARSNDRVAGLTARCGCPPPQTPTHPPPWTWPDDHPT